MTLVPGGHQLVCMPVGNLLDHHGNGMFTGFEVVDWTRRSAGLDACSIP